MKYNIIAVNIQLKGLKEHMLIIFTSELKKFNAHRGSALFLQGYLGDLKPPDCSFLYTDVIVKLCFCKVTLAI